MRIYGIGYGPALLNHLDGFTGGDLLRAWAAATGGRYYEAPTGADMVRVYAQVVADLRGGGLYTLQVTVPDGRGRLTLTAGGEPITGATAPRQVELILDASGSMNGKMKQGGTRIAVARKVLYQIIDELPDATEVALRIYGHRKPSKPKAVSCVDSELVVPFGPLDRQRLKEVVKTVQVKGQTPIGVSLVKVYEDFGQAPGAKMVIVVTDGIETCNADPADELYPPTIARLLRQAGIDVTINVVGFAIGEAETDSFLADLAKSGGGEYFSAEDGDALIAALRAAMQATYEVDDASGKAVARGRVGGDPVLLPAGVYDVVLATDPPRRIEAVEIKPAADTTVTLLREGDRFDTAIGWSATP